MIGVSITSLADKNRLEAFKHYVSEWKKQNADTVTYMDGIYSYTTKRGIIKLFVSSNKPTTIKVNGFYFSELN